MFVLGASGCIVFDCVWGGEVLVRVVLSETVIFC